MLYVSAIALLAAAFVPWLLDPLVFGFSEHYKGVRFEVFVLPILIGLSYLAVAATPAALQGKIPPTVAKWLPFGGSLLGVGMVGFGGFLMALGFMGGAGMFLPALGVGGALKWGYPILIFGLLARLSDERDPGPRYIIGVGAVLCLITFLSSLEYIKYFFNFDSVLLGIHNVIFFFVLLLAAASVAFVLPPEKFPALRAVDRFAPHVAAVLLAFPFVSIVYLMVAGIIESGSVLSVILIGGHALAFTVGYLGVLLVTAPEAYDEGKRLFAGTGGGGAWGGGGGGGGYPHPGPHQPQQGHGAPPGAWDGRQHLGAQPPVGGPQPQGGSPAGDWQMDSPTDPQMGNQPPPAWSDGPDAHDAPTTQWQGNSGWPPQRGP